MGRDRLMMAWTAVLQVTNKCTLSGYSRVRTVDGLDMESRRKTPIWGVTARDENQGKLMDICHSSACSVAKSPSYIQRMCHCVNFWERMLVLPPGSWDTVPCLSGTLNPSGMVRSRDVLQLIPGASTVGCLVAVTATAARQSGLPLVTIILVTQPL